MKFDRVHHIELKKGQDVTDLITSMKKSNAFNAGRLAEACDLFVEMRKTDRIFLGLAGALIPAGQRKVIRTAISEGMVDVLVTTGANITHDLLEAFGEYHFHGPSIQDTELHEKGISRIYDVHVNDSAFTVLENEIYSLIQEIFPISKTKKTSVVATNILLRKIGLAINDKNSILRTAAECNVPVFCPAITDSMLGVHLSLINQQGKGPKIDPFAELNSIIGIAFDSDKTGAVIIGGGVPKNYIFQAMLISGRSLNHAIQITMDRPEHGGLSGASLEEAISWGKVTPKARHVTVVIDASIALPILVSYALDNK